MSCIESGVSNGFSNIFLLHNFQAHQRCGRIHFYLYKWTSRRDYFFDSVEVNGMKICLWFMETK